MLEDGGFNTEHFRAIEDFVVGASVLAFGAEDIPEPQLFSGFFLGGGGLYRVNVSQQWSKMEMTTALDTVSVSEESPWM